jgi:DNA-binding response OmpR family regulator
MPDLDRTVLVLEGDAAAREAIRGFFEDAGWRVLAARGSRAARALVARSRARLDLLIVDPVRGAGLLGVLGSETRPPLVLVSSDRNVAVRAAELGALGVLAKPVRLSGLLDLYGRIERAGHALV